MVKFEKNIEILTVILLNLLCKLSLFSFGLFKAPYGPIQGFSFFGDGNLDLLLPFKQGCMFFDVLMYQNDQKLSRSTLYNFAIINLT